MPASTEKKIDEWAIVDLFGHTRIAGRVSEHVLGGCSFVRVDVPAFDDTPEFTELYGQGAIYAIRFVSEEIARGMARSLQKRPVSMYELPEELRQRLQSVPAIGHKMTEDDFEGLDDDDLEVTDDPLDM
jgi:hypothetical protein